MTKGQAVAMNKRFLTMDSTIKAHEEAYKFKYFQYNESKKSIARQDSVIGELNRQLMVKPAFKRMTQQDILMSTYFVIFSSALFYVNFK